jgi:tetratricopeptide (TPR) repeat protein
VLLYALLVGSTPFDATTLASAGIDEARRRIREEDPPTPSTRLRTVLGDALAELSRKRAMNSHELLRSIEGDLDWIVMKALEKERTRRYDTASGLAKDIDRFLNNDPVLARPPSNLYRLQKFARRNRGAFTAAVVMVLAACAVVIVLAIGLAVSTWLLVREREARQVAADARAQAALTEAEVIAFGNPELIERVARARASQGQLEDATELLQQGRLTEAEQLLDSMLDPKAAGGSFNIQVLEMRVDLLARQGRFKEAATSLARLMELEPEDHWHWFILAPILLELGDEAAYQNVRRAMLEQFQDTEDALAAERITKAASLRPLEPADLEIVHKLEHVFAQAGTREYLADEFAQYQEAFQLGSALVEFRSENFDRAARLAGTATGSSYAFFIPTANAILAMSRHHQGRTSEARTALDAGRQAADRLPQLTDPDMGPLWNDVLIADLMLREAAATLGLPTDSAPGPAGAAPNP